jgi:MSHA pilin protein MshA
MKTINKTQQGFTLVELIIVIVILGILAVTAAPRFLNLAGDAKGATLSAVEASIISANSLVNGKALINGKGNGAAASTNFVLEGTDKIFLAHGYPVTDVVAPSAAGNTDGLVAGAIDDMWGKLLDVNVGDFVIEEVELNASNLFVTPGSGTKAIIVRPADIPLPTTLPSTAANSCYAYVVQSTGAGVKPLTGVVTTGCSQ